MKTIIILNSEHFGHGEEILGERLMGSFLRKLWANETKPYALIFYHAAVKLLIKGSPVLDALEGLEKAGVDLIACGTCVAYYDVKEKMSFGRVSDMVEIVSVLMAADKVITM